MRLWHKSSDAWYCSTAIDLRYLCDHLILIKQKLVLKETRKRNQNISIDFRPAFELVGVNDANTEDDEDDCNNGDNASNFEDIQTRFKQSLSGCKSTVPLAISEAFQGVQSDLNLTGTHKTMEYLYEKYHHFRIFDYMHLKAFDILSVEITNSRFFPICLPNSDEMVEVTMYRLRKKAKEAENYWISECV